MTPGQPFRERNSRASALRELLFVAEQFHPAHRISDITEFGTGNINHTYLVTLKESREKRFILQRINTQVFRRPELVMRNMRVLCQHVQGRLKKGILGEGRRWETPDVLLTGTGEDRVIGPDGSFWRAISFIEEAQSFETIQNLEHAEELGHALGLFHSLLSDLSPDKMADTLEGFHVTPLYLEQYEIVLGKSSPRKTPEAAFCQAFVAERRQWAYVLENAKVQGKLPLRTIHGDPKVNNIMVDTISGKSVSMVDLDTVKPGLVHYDIGDCLRSGCNPLGEETGHWEKVFFDTDICHAIIRGYLGESRDFLRDGDYRYFYEAIRLIAFELGLRFFTDYLEGNRYFKVKNPDHNLLRALVQFKLCESIEAQAPVIKTVIESFR